MNSKECTICFERYNHSSTVPKNLPCGHVYCLTCLEDEKRLRGFLACPICRSRIETEPRLLVTNYSILSEASDSNSQFYCADCKKGADWDCERAGHLLRGMRAHRTLQTESVRKALDSCGQLLEKVVPRVLHLGEISKTHLHQTMAAQDACGAVSKRLKAYMNGTGESDVTDALRDADETVLRLPLLEQAVQWLELEGGTCSLELQVGAAEAAPEAAPGAEPETGVKSTYKATLNLADLSSKPEILAVAQYLLYLLGKDGFLQERKKAKPKPKKAAANAQGGHDGNPGGQGGLQQGQAGGQQGGQQGGRQGQGDARPACGGRGGPAALTAALPPSLISGVEIKEDGTLDLDLESSGVGSASRGLMVSEKEALLHLDARVTHLSGLICTEDPTFCTRLIQKHAPYLESLFVRQVQQEHVNLLGSLRALKNLKVVGYVGHITARMPPQPDCQLRSLYVTLPLRVQLDLWEAFAASVSNVVIRVPSSSSVHGALRPVAARTPNLRHLQLHRKRNDDHNADECAKQLAAVRGAMRPDVAVKCNICGA